ncbi:hypothetical protein [Microbacterium sp. SORGH_AS_0862]|uniref:hypothetical protein n=1 Tax=Microbacterium sp. SORGH_AS_0862 TaxID=3041789 RepID=UPI002792E2FA|nr:hypothetical protein [Microbacterium sp. SORGH_AS_0862]MDQ1205131.1 hypothetical protein [Microbacterium sp. SORGH_AS_0862]
MDESVNGSPRRVGRILLLAAGVGLLWAGVSVLTSTSSAHADDDDRGGLIGLVGGVTGAASDLVGATTGAVGDILPPVAPVTDAASQTVSTVTTAVSDTVAYVPEVVPELQPVVEPVVTEIVQPVVTEIVQPVVTDVVQPVVDGVGGIVEPVPVVSDVVGAIDLPSVVGVVSDVVGAVPGVVGSVDDTVGTVIGTPGQPTNGGVVPSVPIPGTDQVSEPGASPHPTQEAATAALVAALTATVDARHASVAGAGGAAFATPSAAAPARSLDLFGAPPLPGHSAPWEGSAPSGSSSSGSSSGPLSFALGWVNGSAWPGSAGSAVAPRDGDDDLPSSPVFDTDVAPD